MEEETQITPEIVKAFNKPTHGFLCSPKDNIYQIKFLHFKVRDLISGQTLFEVEDNENDEDNNNDDLLNNNNNNSEENRTIRYHLGPDFLDLTTLGTSLKFSVGPLPVKKLLMVERHYFRNTLVKSFEFQFDFCLPNSINTWETIYEVPELDEEIKEEMKHAPWEVESDSFYFVDSKLIMHHKALYNYTEDDE